MGQRKDPCGYKMEHTVSILAAVLLLPLKPSNKHQMHTAAAPFHNLSPNMFEQYIDALSLCPLAFGAAGTAIAAYGCTLQ